MLLSKQAGKVNVCCRINTHQLFASDINLLLKWVRIQKPLQELVQGRECWWIMLSEAVVFPCFHLSLDCTFLEQLYFRSHLMVICFFVSATAFFLSSTCSIQTFGWLISGVACFACLSAKSSSLYLYDQVLQCTFISSPFSCILPILSLWVPDTQVLF